MDLTINMKNKAKKIVIGGGILILVILFSICCWFIPLPKASKIFKDNLYSVVEIKAVAEGVGESFGTAEFIDELDKRFVEFLSGIAGNEMKAEYLLPSIVDDLIKEGSARVKVLDTKDKWFGVTYQEDKFIVRDSLKRLVEQGVYPEKLF